MGAISILIPIYNHDFAPLVKSIYNQLLLPHGQYEIVLLDDFSDEEYKINEADFVGFENVKIYFNEQNLGRELSRKKLASLATFENLLFLDCDSIVVSEQFIKNYFDIAEKYTAVVVGGTVYQTEIPVNKLKILHWKYGAEREIIKNKHAFKANNFLIKKNIFNSVPIFKGFIGYGHEDTFWGIWFETNNHFVQVIDNPVLHNGLEDNTVFLEKSKQALFNLQLLSKSVDGFVLARHVQLFRYYKKLERLKLIGICMFVGKVFEKNILKNLLSSNPSMVYFNIFKLINFCKIVQVGYKKGL